jgi:16S rRNA (uracil1498-N3)-methyltransferase
VQILAVNANTMTDAAIMPLKRLYVAEKLAAGAELRVGEEAARYLGRVLRLRSGDTVHVFNGDDGEWSATIGRFGKDRVTLLLHAAIENTAEPELSIHLVQGISRGERMDFVVQKATELGVARISPVLTDHGVVKLDGERAEKRRIHWQGVAVSACEQSGRVRPPVIDTPLPLNEWLGADPGGDALRRVLRPGAEKPFTTTGAPAAGLCLLVGPEGGFSEREYDDAGFAGYEAVTLGPRILRTETAAVAAIAIAQALWGDL